MARTNALGKRFAIARPLIVAVAVAALLVGGRFILLPLVVIVGLVLAARKRQNVAEILTSGLRWYEYIGLGLALLLTIGVGSFLVPDEIPSGLGETLWLVSFISFVAGWCFILFGAVSAAVTAWRRFRPIA